MFSRDGLLPSRQWELGRCISTGSSLWLICLLSGLSRRCIFSDLYLPSYPPCLFPVLSRCSFPSERQARLEAVREAFLAAYSSTVGLKSSAPSPSGAISGLLEQFARGVGLRGSNAIVWASWWDPGPSCLHQLIQHVCAKQSPPILGVKHYFFNILIYFLFFNMPSILFYFSPVDFKCLRFLSHSGREMVSKRDGDRFRGLLLLQCKDFCLGLFIDL